MKNPQILQKTTCILYHILEKNASARQLKWCYNGSSWICTVSVYFARMMHLELERKWKNSISLVSFRANGSKLSPHHIDELLYLPLKSYFSKRMHWELRRKYKNSISLEFLRKWFGTNFISYVNSWNGIFMSHSTDRTKSRSVCRMFWFRDDGDIIDSSFKMTT